MLYAVVGRDEKEDRWEERLYADTPEQAMQRALRRHPRAVRLHVWDRNPDRVVLTFIHAKKKPERRLGSAAPPVVVPFWSEAVEF